MSIKRISSLIIAASVLLLSGCISVPDSVKGSGTPQENLAMVLATPQQYQGQQVRFGGKVLKVENQPTSTRLEIAASLLDKGARPILDAVSVGRIYADVPNSFLDPVDYRGHLVTILGTVTGTEQGKIGQKPYTFLVVNVQGYQRWQVVQQFMMPPQFGSPWPWGPYWSGSFGYGDWHPPYPVRLQSVIKE